MPTHVPHTEGCLAAFLVKPPQILFVQLKNKKVLVSYLPQDNCNATLATLSFETSLEVCFPQYNSRQHGYSASSPCPLYCAIFETLSDVKNLCFQKHKDN